MSVVDDIVTEVAETRGIVPSIILAFERRDARIQELIDQLAQSGEISAEAAEKLGAALTELDTANTELATAAATEPA